jgi:NodT family efflux transporter outer membrane factor (OMF) lipoprotein
MLVSFSPAIAALAAAALLAGCAAGPDYTRPVLDLPAEYKEAGPWKAADPQPAASGERWWAVYDDAQLDALMTDAASANQSLRVAEARYRQAQALVQEARAGLAPNIGGNASVQRARTTNNGLKEATYDAVGLTASWVPDLWGGIRRSIEAGEAGAEASADDLAGARLSIQAALAQDYLQLRVIDRQRALYATTIVAYQRALKLTQAQLAAGVVLVSDVALAESQLASAQAQATDLEAARTQFEHAIAVLTGRTPAQFSLVQTTEVPTVPATPPGLPSALLERRPDIAAAERRVAQANAGIGVARAAYYPALTLSASVGLGASALGGLLETPSRVWSLGAALAQTLFDGGLRTARDAEAVALHDAAAAEYKQTVLSGFQQVEDNLAALRFLDREAAFQAQAVQSAQTAERLALIQYRGGTATYLSVVTAQTLSLASQRTAVQLRGRQLAASVGLVTALGGGWTAAAGPAALVSSSKTTVSSGTSSP